MTPEQKAGQLACIEQMRRTLPDLERAAIVTGVGLDIVDDITSSLLVLRYRTSRANPESPRRVMRSHRMNLGRAARSKS